MSTNKSGHSVDESSLGFLDLLSVSGIVDFVSICFDDMIVYCDSLVYSVFFTFLVSILAVFFCLLGFLLWV